MPRLLLQSPLCLIPKALILMGLHTSLHCWGSFTSQHRVNLRVDQRRIVVPDASMHSLKLSSRSASNRFEVGMVYGVVRSF
ncbi:hypothetical protein M758_9G021500 [Ceratodon purpureus]|nr:hypothetical protein M758_9G021500 [Ceratodon purpureus]